MRGITPAWLSFVLCTSSFVHCTLYFVHCTLLDPLSCYAVAAAVRHEDQELAVMEQFLSLALPVALDVLYALVDGTVQFRKGRLDRSTVSVVPVAAEA